MGLADGGGWVGWGWLGWGGLRGVWGRRLGGWGQRDTAALEGVVWLGGCGWAGAGWGGVGGGVVGGVVGGGSWVKARLMGMGGVRARRS